MGGVGGYTTRTIPIFQMQELKPQSFSADGDTGLRDPCVVAKMRTTETCGGKGTGWPLSPEESASTFDLTGFYCFSGHITLRMILIYSAQVCFRWLQKIKERVLLIT